MAYKKKDIDIKTRIAQKKGTGYSIKRNHKDAVFRKLFSDKHALLSLYNAVHGTDYSNPDDLRNETLDNAVYMKVKNDVSFVIQSRLVLYEHQSSVNANLPLRNLLYVSDVLHRITDNADLHLRSPQHIPTPEFIVFYNGVEEQPEKVTLKLSELFEVQTDDPQLELIVTQLNINPGYNTELLKKCRELQDYSTFVSKIRERTRRGESIQEAVPEVIEECIAAGILREFLRREKAEVTAMSIYEYDEEWHLANLRKEALDEGEKKGITIGRKLERANTLREKERADAAEKRANAAVAEAAALKARLRELGELS